MKLSNNFGSLGLIYGLALSKNVFKKDVLIATSFEYT